VIRSTAWQAQDFGSGCAGLRKMPASAPGYIRWHRRQHRYRHWYWYRSASRWVRDSDTGQENEDKNMTKSPIDISYPSSFTSAFELHSFAPFSPKV
jgi:hypothetical protein